MKILHVITGLNDGGAEAVLFRMISYDNKNEHCVISLSNSGKYGPLLQELGVQVSALNMPKGRVSLQGLLQLWRGVHSSHVDVIQTWMYHADLLGGLAGRLALIPVVWCIRNSTLHPGFSTRTTIWISRLCALLSRWVPTYIIVCAKTAARVHEAIGYDSTRMVVIPNGFQLSSYPTDPLSRQQLRLTWDVSHKVPAIGMVARYDPQKDHANLLNALVQVRRRCGDFRLILVGNGCTDQNNNLIAQLGSAGLMDRVLLLGARDDVPAIMNALDIHVLSSSYGEAFPNVLAEAMACGTPCVTTDVGDAALIVANTGWIVPPRNSEAFANALQAAIASWSERDSWTARQMACRQRIMSYFGIVQMVDQYRDVWQAAVN